jgi:predicted alpha/beta-fold hydrolase
MLAKGKSILKKDADVATSKWPDLIDRGMNAETVMDFHSKFVSAAYEQGEVNSIALIDQITCPTIFFYAVDDPFVDFASVDLVRLIRKAEVATVVTEQGGHCGSFVGLKGRRWIPDYTLDFLISALMPTI